MSSHFLLRQRLHRDLCLLSRVVTILLPLAIISTVYLYLYPIFHGCAFSLPEVYRDGALSPDSLSQQQQGFSSTFSALLNTFYQHVGSGWQEEGEKGQIRPAVFRLLVLADPQLEGDTSLPDKEDELLPRIKQHWNNVRSSIVASSSSSSSSSSLTNSSFSSSSTASSNITSDSLPSSNGTSPFTWIPIDRTILSNITTAFREFTLDDIPRSLRAVQKRIDLLGNDFYLAHIYRTLHWWSRPTHVTVLGDLIGSQWVGDEEFARRGQRFWERVFKGGERVGDDVTFTGSLGKEKDHDRNNEGYYHDLLEFPAEGENNGWSRRIINVAGNHDIGYAGDISEARIERFERVFGRANWDVRFRLRTGNNNSNSTTTTAAAAESTTNTPTLHLINLNSLTLDTPALSSEIQSNSYAYINDIINHRSYPVEDRTSFTLLLTHLPLHKDEGICTDGPNFTFHESDDEDGDEDGDDVSNGNSDGDDDSDDDKNNNNDEIELNDEPSTETGKDNDDNNGNGKPNEPFVPSYREGGLKDQNHLSQHVSGLGILEGLFGMSGNLDAPARGIGRNGLILTGHDHTGCDVVHYVDRSPSRTRHEKKTEKEQEQEQEDEDEDEFESETPKSWKWNARHYHNNKKQKTDPDPENPTPTPSIREVTLRSMMGEFGGNAGLLSIWFEHNRNNTTGEWKYKITTCKAGVQHIWWAIHVLAIVTFISLGLWNIVLGAFVFVWGLGLVSSFKQGSGLSPGFESGSGSLSKQERKVEEIKSSR